MKPPRITKQIKATGTEYVLTMDKDYADQLTFLANNGDAPLGISKTEVIKELHQQLMVKELRIKELEDCLKCVVPTYRHFSGIGEIEMWRVKEVLK